MSTREERAQEAQDEAAWERWARACMGRADEELRLTGVRVDPQTGQTPDDEETDQ